MTKIRVEIEVPSGEYCDEEDTICLGCTAGNWDKYYCAIFGDDLEIDIDHGFCIRCNKCKQFVEEVENE